MSGWAGLNDELNRWADGGRTAHLWWRDDDAVAATSALDRLLGVADDVPLSLAVISMRFDDSLTERLKSAPPSVTVLPHGAHHANHEPPDRKKAEYGAARDPEAALAEIAAGLRRLERGFGTRLRPLFVPPWNRIDGRLADRLGLAGIGGLSVFNDRTLGADGPPRLNTHVDILNWGAKKREGAARFVGKTEALTSLTDALARRREGAPDTDPAEAVGLLTHHLEHDEASWDFLAALREAADKHPAVRWIAPEEGLAA